MKNLLLFLSFSALTLTGVKAQVYLHPTAGVQSTYAGTCEVNTCSGTYYDNGGAAGNYSTFIGYPAPGPIYRTFCPSTPGTAVSITFTSFSIEAAGGGPWPGGCWDILQVGNGPTQNSPIIAQGCGTSLNGVTVTSTHPSGCLTVKFYSDNVVVGPGWTATIACTPLAGGPTGLTNNDCINATGVCDNGFSFAGLSNGPGLVSDDCGGASCVVSENFSNWYEFTIQTSGVLGFNLNTGLPADDYDFALYQAAGCGSLGTPVRCSYAGTTGTTGMGNAAVDNSEDVNGNGWVATLNVTAGQHYYLLINEWTPNGSSFVLDWTGTAVVATPLPDFIISATNYPNGSSYTVCQGSALTITANGTGGTYQWYNAPVGGTLLNTGANYSPSTATPGSTTYYVQETTLSGCTTASRSTITVNVTAAPSATISYAGTPFCTSLVGAQSVTQTGTAGGTYSSTAGLSINAATGAITPSTSTPGTYTVTYTIAAAGGCAAFSTTTSVTITAAPTATISYSGSPFCTSVAAPQAVTQTGTAGGTYSSTAGLSINAATGAITPSTSTPGTYTVTYSIAAAGGCAAFSTTASVTITAAPTATISYAGSPFCTSLAAPQAVTQTGTAGGTYSSTAGLSINAATGAITPSTSTPGTYTVTYSIAAAGGCAAFSTTASVTITAAPTATISYAGSPFCTSVAAPQAVTQTGTSGGTYSSTAGLTINAGTGAITPSTSTPGTYTVTYTIAAAGGCAAFSTTASVTITAAPTATISYAGSPFCTSLAAPQAVTQTGTVGGTYTAAPAGLSINAATGAITPSTSTAGTYTVTYTIAAAGGCAAFTTTASVTITAAPTATISYASPFCTSLAAPQAVTQTGTAGGTYTAAPAGLSINAATGAITPSTSSAGTYTVTYTIAAAGGCAAFTTTASVTITAAPTATISYASPFCTSLAAPQAVTQTGTVGGTYTAAPAGLTINAATGAITPSTSTAGTYTVTYTIAAAGGCAAFTTTASVTITAAPTATISYGGSPYCTSLAAPQAVTQTGTAGGTYTAAPAGLSINAATGAITPSTSTAGTYTVTYTIAAAGGCAAFTTTASVTITAAPTATISYASPFCTSLAAPQAVTQTGTAGGTYTAAPAGLTINAATGAITPSTSTAGTYTVTYTIAAAGGCAVFTTTASVTITAAPTATISYAGSPYCTSIVGTQSVTQTGTAGGTYTSAPAGLTINAATGVITPSSSTGGTYTVTYTIAAAGGCAAFTTTASVTITPAPTATISYTGSPYCNGLAAPQSVTVTGTAGGSFSSAPAGLTLNTVNGDVTPSTSTPGTYTVTYSIPASAGCAAFSTTASVTITSTPTASISYAGSPYCGNLGSQSVTQTGAAGGTYTAVPAGLTLNAATGAVTPSSSTPGTYTVTYTVPASGGCAAVTTTASVTISTAPSATISYAGSPYCTSVVGAQSVTQTGTAGGTYSSTAGLSINAATGAITPSTSTAGTYTVTYTIAASGGCPVYTTTASVTITAAPTATISYPGSPYCASSGVQSVTQTGSTGGTYSSTAGLSINAATGAITPSTSTAGTYTVTYSIAAAGGCAAFSTTASVTITDPPTTANSGAPQTICATSGSVLMSGNTPLIGTGSWSQISGPVVGTITTPGSPSTTITGLTSPGAYVFQWSITNPPCTPSTSNVTITVNPAPTVSAAGPAQTICSSSGSATMAANSPTVGTGTWTQISGPVAATITNASLPNTTITGLTTAGVYVFQWSIANAPCANSTSTVSITVSANPVFAIGTIVNPSGCGLSDGSITLTGLNASTAYTISYNDGSLVNLGTVTTNASGNYIISGLGAGTYTTFTVVNAAGCSTTVAGPASLVDPSAPTGTAGAASTNPTTCGGTDGTITISGLTPSSSYDISYTDGSTVYTLTGVMSTAGGTYVITGLPAGTYSGFSLTLTGCTGSAAGSVTLTDPVSPSFTSGATFTNPNSCGAADGTITISGLNASTSYTISYDGPSGTVNLGVVTTDASGNYIIIGLISGTYTNFVITSSALCSTTSGTTVTLVDPSAPVFTPGSTFTDPTTCSGVDGTITITGLNPNTTYDMDYTGPLGAVSLVGVTTDATGAYVITGLGAGTYNGFVVTLAGCNGNSAVTISLTDPAMPTFSAGTTSTNPTTCGGTDGTITITGLNPSSPYTVSYDGPSGTVNLGVVSSDASGNYIISGLPAGSYFNFSVTSTGCTTTDVVTVVNLTDPGAPTFTISGSGTNPSGCGALDGSFSITGLSPNTTYDFIYDNGSVVTVTGTTDAFGNYTVTGLGSGSYTNISVSLAGCTSVNSTTITLVDPPITGFTITGTNPTTCGGSDGFITISGLTPNSSYDYSYFDGTTTITATVTSSATGDIVISGLPAGTYDSFGLIFGSCTGSSATIITLVDPGAPNAPVAGTDASYCQGDAMVDMTATAANGGTLTWYSDPGLTTVVGTGATLTPSSTLGATTYYVTETAGGCEGTASTVTITITAIPSTPVVASPSTTYCSTDAFSAMTAVAGSGGNIVWFDDVALTSVVGNGTSLVPLNIIGTTVYYIVEDVNGCQSSIPATISITVTDCDTLEIEIPTGFTPSDGDGVNDVWDIPNLNIKYPTCKVSVYGRWGGLLFESEGYATPWDGTYNGKQLPVGSYYFVIDLGDGSDPIKGTVTIIN